jgi:aspartate racemase
MVKTIGLIGGMSWESSAVYYKIINQEVQKKLGGVHSCQSLMYSVDFDEIAALQHHGNWEELEKIMCDAAQRLEKGGADFIILCTNTMHKFAEQMEKTVAIPLIHIADATAESIMAKNMSKIGLLGTKFTMEQNFLKGRLYEKHGIETIIPNEAERNIIHHIIYEELIKGIIKDKSKNDFLKIINNLSNQGAEGIVLGCTEISILVSSKDTNKILFDTTEIHAKKAVNFALRDNLD